ncbi:hypothetical protein MVEN_00483900 [Mycena venus]|uniref:Uncharacterized protein n=1 Tax=Mycena venus TaxID=2733690 RepID=A0A8H6YVP4_9AGAR|nr:hypothetical protein MVEN_00483900 [Mycena venus]
MDSGCASRRAFNHKTSPLDDIHVNYCIDDAHLRNGLRVLFAPLFALHIPPFPSLPPLTTPEAGFHVYPNSVSFFRREFMVGVGYGRRAGVSAHVSIHLRRASGEDGEVQAILAHVSGLPGNDASGAIGPYVVWSLLVMRKRLVAVRIMLNFRIRTAGTSEGTNIINWLMRPQKRQTTAGGAIFSGEILNLLGPPSFPFEYGSGGRLCDHRICRRHEEEDSQTSDVRLVWRWGV